MGRGYDGWERGGENYTFDPKESLSCAMRITTFEHAFIGNSGVETLNANCCEDYLGICETKRVEFNEAFESCHGDLMINQTTSDFSCHSLIETSSHRLE